MRLADAVASRLCKTGVGARTFTLKVRFDDGFTTITDTLDPSPGVRLVGVSGSNFGPVFHRTTLDEAADDAPVHGATDAALDVIRDRFGADAIGAASAVKGGKVRNVKRGGQQWGPDQ